SHTGRLLGGDAEDHADQQGGDISAVRTGPDGLPVQGRPEDHGIERREKRIVRGQAIPGAAPRTPATPRLRTGPRQPASQSHTPPRGERVTLVRAHDDLTTQGAGAGRTAAPP